jgi:hypothetical protein
MNTLATPTTLKTKLTDKQKQEILEALEQMAEKSGPRPWMAIIRCVDGVLQLYEATPPARPGVKR